MATDFFTIQKEVTAKFSLLNDIYFKVNDDNNHSFKKEGILGGSDGYIIGADSLINYSINSNINQLYNLNNTGILLSDFININTDSTNVYLYNSPNSTNSYIGSYNSGTLLANVINLTDLTNISEINCLSLLSTPDSTSNPPVTRGSIYNFMQGLHTLYNLFEANTWQSYLDSIKNNTESAISFGIPYVNTNGAVRIGTTDGTDIIVNGTNLDTYVNYVSPTLLNTISFSTSFNPYVARRLIYIWILLCNYLIATKYLKIVGEGTDRNDTKATNASNLIDKIYQLIVQANKNVINNDNPITDAAINANPNTYDSDKTAEETYEINGIKYSLFTWAIEQITQNANNVVSTMNTNYTDLKSNSNSRINSQYDTIKNQKNSANESIYPKILPADKSTLVDSVINGLDTIFMSTPAKTVTQINSAIEIQRNSYNEALKIRSGHDIQVNVFGSINKAVGEYINTYDNNQTDINAISELLKTGKAELSTVKDLLNGRLSTQKTQRICEYVAITILILFALVSFSIILMDVDKKLKLFGCIGLILFALLHFLGIQMLLNSSIFILKAPSKPLIEKFAITATSIPSYLNYYNIEVMNQVSEYLDNTFTLVTLLESYKVYGNMNLSMDREIDYYNTIVSQLNNAQSKINNVYFSSYINTIDVSSLLHLFQILTIIIAATTTLFVLVEDFQDNSIRNWIASIAGIFAVLSFVVYLLEVNTRVRTNPVKVYWGDVDKNSFHD